MASTFMGISIANTGLSSSQIGLSTTTNNISNENTTGYSRQVVTQIAVGPAAVYTKSSYVGSGSDVTSVDRVSSFRLNQKYWEENTALGEWDTKSSYLTQVEEVLGTSSDDDDFSTTMDSFYSALSDLSSDPSSDSARAVVREDGEAVCEYLNNASSELTSLRADVNSDVKTQVDEINSYSQQIADLNQRISVAEASGSSANELEDQRDLLVDKLSALADVSVTKTVIGTTAGGSDVTTYDISVGGATLVSGNEARQLECTTGTDGMYDVVWADTGASFSPGSSGSLKADLDLRDGTGSDGEYQGIPYYMSQLDTFAQTFAEAFNEGVYKDGSSYYSGYSAGYGTDGNTGYRFFSYDGLSSSTLAADISSSSMADVYANITAANISLSSDVEDDLSTIAAASSADDTSGDNTNVQNLISICDDSRMFASGTAEDYYNSIIATLGTATSFASRQDSVQSSIASYIDSSRSSVSGVSTNEETANLT
ncbi:MAG: flagellar hook-associated protein FlgK, partial [Negativicutes bacterium]|nr:flagellar hook-associated protein FlgK [Negativicutes bacterium]